MPIDRRRTLALLAGTAAALPLAAPAGAQLPAARQTRLVVPFPAGGPTDAAARIIAEALRTGDGPPVIVENKPGGAGTIGTRLVRDAPADGFTLLLGNNQTHATAPFLIKDAGYDPVADFAPIAGVGSFAHVLVVRRDLGADDVAALVAMAKATPGRLSYGSTGVGSGSHLAMELFATRAGIALQHVPYQGAAQLGGDLVAGRLDLALAILPSVLAQVSAGQLRALAVAGRQRAGQLAAVPTLKEAGIEGGESESWLALFAPKGSPEARVRAIGELLAQHLAGGVEIGRRLAQLGIDPAQRPAAEFRLFQQSEIERWQRVIATIGLKPE